MLTKIRHFAKRMKIALIVAAAVIVVAIVAFSIRGNGDSQTVVVSRGELVRTVELSGKVIPQDDADLAFEVSGTVVRAGKKVGEKVRAGEVIAELDRSSTYADLLKAEADLAAARAELAKIEGGASLQAKVTNSKASIVQSIIDAYADSDDAIYNKADQLFTNPRTQNPEITFAFDDYALRDKINKDRVRIGEILNAWRAVATRLNASNFTQDDLDRSKVYIRQVMAFIDDVALAVNGFEANSSLPQATIDKYRSDISTARTNVNAASAALISGEGSLTATVSDLPVQAARVSAAEATAANYRSRLGKMVLRSPIDGVISKQDAKAGEAVSANTVVASVISEGKKIEAYVPEVSVAGVSLGAKAIVTLDAYGAGESFIASVTHIDPRETVRDGVSTYKIELGFSTADERIRSGMTSNITIETMRRQNALLVPSRAVVSKDSEKKVLVKDAEGEVSEKQVVTGLVDTQGNIEILGGLGEGDVILLNPTK
jgi:HlyD family secretion protein